VFVIKVQNIPRHASEDMFKRKLIKTIKDIKYEKIGLETDKTLDRGNLGTAWVSTKDRFTVKQLIKLHNHVSRHLFYASRFIFAISDLGIIPP
jgi:hypothetical protein